MLRLLLVSLIGLFVLGADGFAAQEQAQTRDSAQEQKQLQEQTYGWSIMSEQERHEYQRQMRERTTAEEREVYRLQHHQMMQERARQQGLSLPETPGSFGKGMGPGGGQGRGGGR